MTTRTFECPVGYQETDICHPCRDCQTSECTLSCSMKDLPKPPLSRMDCVGKTCDDPACKDSLQCGNHDLSSTWSTENGADEDPMEAAEKRRQDQETRESKKATERDTLDKKIAACRKHQFTVNEEGVEIERSLSEAAELCQSDPLCSWDSFIDGTRVCRPREENPSESLARVALTNCTPGDPEGDLNIAMGAC